MSALLRIAAVADNTMREAIRSRVLYVLLFFAVGIMSLGVLLSTLSYVEQERILQAIEKAKKARADAGLDDLRGRLADMERAAAIIGQAMLRP